MPNVKGSVQKLRRILTGIGWEPEQDGESSFYVDFGPPHMPVSGAIAAIVSDAQQFVFYINFGQTALPERRNDVATFITLANSDLLIGNFEMDFENGHVRFKTSFDFTGEQMSESLVRNAILSAMNAVESYSDALIAVINRRTDARRAIKEVEAKLSKGAK